MKVKKNKKSRKIDFVALQKSVTYLSYKSFLKSRYWIEVKKRILKRDGYKCVLCGSTLELNIHHNTYKNFKNEHRHLNDLSTLCNNCHYNVHLVMEII